MKHTNVSFITYTVQA